MAVARLAIGLRAAANPVHGDAGAYGFCDIDPGKIIMSRMDAPVWALGLRPFYLLAAIFALVAIPVWIASYVGLLQWSGYLHGPAWHSHEMIFGFAAAVICGFLLTAVRNWTGQPTLSDTGLAALVALWLMARLTALTGPAAFAAIIDSAFLPALAIAVFIPIRRSRNVRNYKILLVLAGLSSVNIQYHLSWSGMMPGEIGQLAIRIALDMITLLMAIVAGRVIPAFTANAVPSAHPRHNKSLEIVALGSLLLILVGDITSYWYSLVAAGWGLLLAVAAVAHGIRLWLWQPQRTVHNPLLWMLPVAYSWIPISLALRAAGEISGIPAAAAVHALSLGAISSLMLAMMARSALGHTGRELRAGWIEINAFLLIQLAAVIRVGATLAPPVYYRGAVILSGTLWSLAFALFLSRYWGFLTRPRIDGRPG
jgi:uncharacterized protein involved in response to NO